MRRARAQSVLLASILSVLATAGCREDARANSDAAPDTALAADLRRASGDTSAYGEAAEVATAAVPDSALMTPAAPPPPMIGTDSAARSPVTPAAPPPGALPAAARVETLRGVGCESPALADQKRCLMAHLSRSDLELDRAYQAVIAEMKRQSPPAAKGREPDVVTKLRVQERAWLVYRDTECRRLNRGKEGPLWAPLRAQCLGEFSAHRTAQLRDALTRMQQR